jgi:uncharacterized protein (TIGR02145 family)
MKLLQKSSLLLLGITFSLIGCLSDESNDSVGTSSTTMSSSSTVIAGSSLVINLSSSSGVYGSLTDSRDNQVYKTVVIGSQTWMAQNLNYGTYINDGAASSLLQSGFQKFCYSNTESNCATDGGLYQWHTVMGFASSCATSSCVNQISVGNHQGICPVGWHVPKATEWDTLQAYLGGLNVAGSKMKLSSTGYAGWDATTYNNGNSSGFSGLPAGFRQSYGGFNFRGGVTYFWEITENNIANSYYHILDNGYSNLNRNSNYKTFGFSLRCVKD